MDTGDHQDKTTVTIMVNIMTIAIVRMMTVEPPISMILTMIAMNTITMMMTMEMMLIIVMVMFHGSCNCYGQDNDDKK